MVWFFGRLSKHPDIFTQFTEIEFGLPDRDRRMAGNGFRKRESQADLFAYSWLPRGRRDLIAFIGLDFGRLSKQPNIWPSLRR
jgi:hypothetical protein